MNLPGAQIDLPALTAQDETDILEFGIPNDVDYITASFVRKASEVEYIRDVLASKNQSDMKILSKIENQEGLQNFEEILEVSDGIMILSAELAMELPPEKLMIAQRWMIERANLAAKPVICSIPMLSSLIKGTRCTRTEALDVAQAVADGGDALVLGEETANGENPLLALTTMSKICLEVENTLNYK